MYIGTLVLGTRSPWPPHRLAREFKSSCATKGGREEYFSIGILFKNEYVEMIRSSNLVLVRSILSLELLVARWSLDLDLGTSALPGEHAAEQRLEHQKDGHARDAHHSERVPEPALVEDFPEHSRAERRQDPDGAHERLREAP